MLVIRDLSKLESGDEFSFHDSKYKVLERIYTGPFSSVFKLLSSDGKVLALKLESKNGYRNFRASLKMDVTVLKALAGKKGFVELKDVARNADWKAVVMEYIGPDLQRLQSMMPEKKFSPETAYHIALETLDRLEVLHQTGYLHRDIKQGNLAIGLGKNIRCIYMLDFGMARKYINSERQISIRKKGPICGTAPFASMAAQCSEDLSPKDDLENWLYMCIHSIKGSLPWYQEECEANSFMMWDWKRWTFEMESLFDDLNDKWQTIQKVISHCPRNHQAPFELVRDLLKSIIEEDGIDIDQPLDWESEPFLRQAVYQAASKNGVFGEQ